MDFDAPAGVRTVADPVNAGINRVTASYFEVMGMPLVAGRTFGANVRGAPREAILNESAARALFGGASPLGQEIRIYGARPSIVVGVVRDAKYGGVRDVGVPMVHQDFRQDVPTGGVVVLVRSAHAGTTLSELRQVLLAIDPTVAQYDSRLVAEQVDAALMTQRFGTMLLGLFAVIALGAGAGDVLRVVVGRSGAAFVAGALLGLAVAVPASRALERFLYDVPPLDRVSFGVAGAMLAMAAVGAILIPARRALRTDPLIALRRE
jgi:hypothetical protein